MTNSIWNHYVKTVQHELYCPAYSCTVMCFKYVTSKTAISILKTTRIPNKKQLRYWRKFSVLVIISTINDLCKSVFWQVKICSWLKSAVLMFYITMTLSLWIQSHAGYGLSGKVMAMGKRLSLKEQSICHSEIIYSYKPEFKRMTDVQIATFSDHRIFYTTAATSLSHPFTNLSWEWQTLIKSR